MSDVKQIPINEYYDMYGRDAWIAERDRRHKRDKIFKIKKRMASQKELEKMSPKEYYETTQTSLAYSARCRIG